jgi:hypothetical protein
VERQKVSARDGVDGGILRDSRPGRVLAVDLLAELDTGKRGRIVVAA